nr:hypothetical protein [Tanacetum cinerariifolium]
GAIKGARPLHWLYGQRTGSGRAVVLVQRHVLVPAQQVVLADAFAAKLQVALVDKGCKEVGFAGQAKAGRRECRLRQRLVAAKAPADDGPVVIQVIYRARYGWIVPIAAKFAIGCHVQGHAGLEVAGAGNAVGRDGNIAPRVGRVESVEIRRGDGHG